MNRFIVFTISGADRNIWFKQARSLNRADHKVSDIIDELEFRKEKLSYLARKGADAINKKIDEYEAELNKGLEELERSAKEKHTKDFDGFLYTHTFNA